MPELDPIKKTVYIVLIAAAIFIIVIILYAKNNPLFAQTILSILSSFTDKVTGYNPNPIPT
jgi:hypothetical protein